MELANFWTFALLALGFGAATVVFRNPVNSAMSLVVCFISLAALNKKWEPRRVALAFYGDSSVTGIFRGLDAHGDLLIEDDAGKIATVPHQSVQRLVEK